MNKRNLALLISKHPLLRKLTEDKTIPNSVVARLIVEELMEAQTGLLKSALAGIRRDFNQGKQGKYINAETNQTVYPYGKLSKLDEKEQQKYKDAVNKKVQAFLAKQNPETEAKGEELEKKVDATIDKEIGAPQDTEQEDETFNSLAPPAQKIVDNIASVVVDIDAEEKFLTTYDQNAPAAIDFVINKLPEEHVDVLKTASPETQQKVVKAVADELQKDQQENPFKDLKGYSELNLKPPEEKVFVQFLTKLQEAKIINEENLVQLSKIVGTGRGLSKIIKSFEPPERKILIVVLQRVEVQKFIQNNLQQIEKPQEPDKEEKPSTPMKGKPVAIDPAQAGAFVGAANELLNDFYNQKYRKAQADIVDKVINSMKAFVEDADLALAFGKPPADKPEEQEATSEEPPKEQEEPDTQKALAEQEEQEVKADKDEMRNIRIGLRSFLSRVNKTNKYLTEFEKVAGAGSVLSDAYKKKFMDNLKEIQTAIYRLALVLNKMLDSKEELNEKKGSETMNKWREVQKLYDLSIKSVSSIKELLDTETPPDELDSTLTNDAYTALIDLAGHFPSVAPFGAGKMKRSDFEEYKTKFANAIGQVKSDLQNVFNLIKTGEAGEESLQNARGGLRDFGDQIASIFGVPSRFKDAKVKPGDDKAPAVQEDPEAKKEPEEEKYSDEISEEDKELLSAALKQDEKFYQRALKIIKSSQDPSSGSIQLEEVVKKTEDLIGELEARKTMAKQQIKRIKDGKVDPGSMEKLVKTLRGYVSVYEKIQDSIRSGDMSSTLDTNPVRVEKVQKLIDISKRYLDQKAAMNNLFVAIINDAFGEDKNLDEIWKALKDADGKEAERLTGDMKHKINSAGKNIKNIISGSFEPEKLDLSSFKKFVGMVADKVSKTAIQLRNKLNEEEEEDIELKPTQDDIERAEKEKADERDAPFKEKELKIYQKNFDIALREMKSFVALYGAFDYAMDQIENEVGRTKFLEAFDEDFSTVKDQLSIMDNHLKKVSKMFGEGTPSLRAAEEYGFPPDDFILPEPEEDQEESSEILDIPKSDVEEIVDVINLNVGKMENPTDFWNKPLKDQVDLVLDMPEIEEFNVKYFDVKPIKKNEEDYEKLMDKAKEEEDIPEKLEYDNLPDETKDGRPGSTTYERIMSSKVPEILGYSSFPEEEEVLKLFKWYQATNKPISESEKLGQTISNRISDKHPKLDKMITSFIDDFLQKYHPEKIEIWSKVMSKTSAMNKKQSAQFINYLLNPIGSKHSPAQKKVKKEGYAKFNRKFTEQVLANKLKPLIREMLTKGK